MAARDLTDDQLLAAWRQCRRDAWPATFEEAMNDRFYSRLVRLEATRRAQRLAPAPARPARAPQPQHRALPVLPALPPVLDHKRRAAGERDDD